MLTAQPTNTRNSEQKHEQDRCDQTDTDEHSEDDNGEQEDNANTKNRGRVLTSISKWESFLPKQDKRKRSKHKYKTGYVKALRCVCVRVHVR